MIVSALIIAIIFCLVLFGPREHVALFWAEIKTRVPKYQPEVESDEQANLVALRELIRQQEAKYPLVEGTEKQIGFYREESPGRTQWVVLYIHGFSASREEISPVPEAIASTLEANYFATRLTGHGLDGETLARSKPNDWLFDLKEAWCTATQLGDNVIVISTSTGGTLAAWLAQQTDVKSNLAALIMVSPNFQPKHWAIPLFLWPWARVWMPYIAGKEYGLKSEDEKLARRWTAPYPTTIIHDVAALVKAVRQSSLERITAPTLFLYCDFDDVVDAKYTDAAMHRWGSGIKHHISVPQNKSANNHVVTGDLLNPGTNQKFIKDILVFLNNYVI